MSLYKGTTLISGAIPDMANQSLSNLNSSGQDKFDAKANTNLNNLTSTSSTNFDGQWIKYNQTIMKDVNIHGTTVLTYTLSLPNDGYNYEVLLSGSIATGNALGNTLILQVSSSILDSTVICRTTNRGTNAAPARSGGSVIIPVSSNHNIYVTRSDVYTGTADLVMKGYRRIGTNS